MVYIFNVILFSLIRNSAICKTWMDLEYIILHEINQTQKDKYCRVPLI